MRDMPVVPGQNHVATLTQTQTANPASSISHPHTPSDRSVGGRFARLCHHRLTGHIRYLRSTRRPDSDARPTRRQDAYIGETCGETGFTKLGRPASTTLSLCSASTSLLVRGAGRNIPQRTRLTTADHRRQRTKRESTMVAETQPLLEAKTADPPPGKSA